MQNACERWSKHPSHHLLGTYVTSCDLQTPLQIWSSRIMEDFHGAHALRQRLLMPSTTAMACRGTSTRPRKGSVGLSFSTSSWRSRSVTSPGARCLAIEAPDSSARDALGPEAPQNKCLEGLDRQFGGCFHARRAPKRHILMESGGRVTPKWHLMVEPDLGLRRLHITRAGDHPNKAISLYHQKVYSKHNESVMASISLTFGSK